MAYWLGRNRLYLQITNRVPSSNVLTLYKARGPGFKISSSFTPISQELTPQELADIVENAYENDERKLSGAGIGMGVRDFLVKKKAHHHHHRKKMRALFLQALVSLLYD